MFLAPGVIQGPQSMKIMISMILLEIMLFSLYSSENQKSQHFNENDISLSSVVEMYSIPIGFQCLLKGTYMLKHGNAMFLQNN